MLGDKEFEELQSLVDSALDSKCDCVVIEATKLGWLLDENERLYAQAQAVGETEGLCDCGRPAEYCRRCITAGLI